MNEVNSNSTLLAVDDHGLFLEGLRLLLGRLGPGTRVLEARSGDVARKLLAETEVVDLVLLDWRVPALNGERFIQELAVADPPVPVLVISATEDTADIAKALDAGALGFVPKTADPDKLLTAIRCVLEGQVYLPADLAQSVAAWRRSRTAPNVSPRQRQILDLLAEGLSNREIAQRLAISEATVKTHVAALFSLLGTGNRTGCVHIARERGLLS